jgi:phosphatidylinositol glycan class U
MMALFTYILFLVQLYYLSFLFIESWSFVRETVLFTLLVPDLSPNVGLFWYLFTEVFEQYKNFFLFAYQYHVFIYCIPLYVRLRYTLVCH